MPRYLKTKVEIANHFAVAGRTVADWANKEWWPQPTKQGWNVKRLESIVGAYRASVDSRGRAIPGRSQTGADGDSTASVADMQIAKLAAEVFKLQQEGEAKKLKNDLNKESLLDAHEVRQWIAERFLRIKQRIQSIPDEMQLLAPVEIRSQFRADMGNFTHELLLEMSSWKFKPEDGINPED